MGFGELTPAAKSSCSCMQVLMLLASNVLTNRRKFFSLGARVSASVSERRSYEVDVCDHKERRQKSSKES